MLVLRVVLWPVIAPVRLFAGAGSVLLNLLLWAGFFVLLASAYQLHQTGEDTLALRLGVEGIACGLIGGLLQVVGDRG